MQVVHQVLKPGGLFLLQTIGENKSVVATDPWTEKYIFPNSMLPSARQLTRSFGELFMLEDWHSFGGDYDRTLMCWYQNFEKAWPELKQAYDERFFRMWKYYLLGAAGGFRARKNQLWQIVLSKEGFPNGYLSVR
jgi:cyclopropane-fatty-acyl-phospholipid synthase